MIQQQLETLYAGKKLLIWGAGREGLSTYRFLRRHFPQQQLWMADGNQPDLSGLDHVTFIHSGTWTEEFDSFDLIFKSPGIPILDPAIDPSKLTSQTELFFHFFRDQIIGITGTKGKSTTSSLLYHILKGCGVNSLFVGNIGIPCLDRFEEIEPDTTIVFELSCHQLECVKVSPHIAVLLNLYQDHLDHYGTYERYVQAKETVFLHQKPEDVIIMNQNDTPQIEKASYPVLASMESHADICISENSVIANNHSLMIPEEGTQLLGVHNRYNIAIVYYICRELFSITDSAFLRELKTFQGLPHRLQYVATVNGVKFYDDSISTVCETTIQGLESLKHVDTLLVGGLDRGIDYTPLCDYLKHSSVSLLILLPETQNRILALLQQQNLEQQFKIVSVTDMQQAVQVAKQQTAPGGICLLSPAAASYHAYQNFEKRGEHFQQLVQESSFA